MKTRNGWVQGYNTQFAVTDDHMVLAVQVSNDPVDMNQFAGMLAAATTAAGTLTDTLTDTADPIGILIADAGYLSHDNLSMPGPDRLIATGRRHKLRVNAPSPPPPPDDPWARNAHTMATPEGLRRYRRRGAVVEPVFGHLKDRVGLRRFARRGLSAVQAEAELAATALNLRRLHRTTTA